MLCNQLIPTYESSDFSLHNHLKILPDQLTAEQYLLTMESCNGYIRFRRKKRNIGIHFLLINGL